MCVDVCSVNQDKAIDVDLRVMKNNHFNAMITIKAVNE